MIVKFHKSFIKSYRRLPLKIKQKADQKMRLFSQNQKAMELNVHTLSGKYNGYMSMNITGDYRALYKIVSKNEVRFMEIGTHAQLYE